MTHLWVLAGPINFNLSIFCESLLYTFRGILHKPCDTLLMETDRQACLSIAFAFHIFTKEEILCAP